MSPILLIATILAYVIKGLTGFANTVVFSSILSFQMENRSISPIDLVLGFPSNIYLTWRKRKNISLKIVMPLSLLVIVGMIPGVLLLGNADQRFIKIIFGIMVIIFGMDTIFRQLKQNKRKSNLAFLTVIGFLSGIACGLFGIGAFLAGYINRTTENQNEFKGNICFVFLVENIVRIVLYSKTGIITMDICVKAIALFPFMILGLVSGILLSKYFNEKAAKTAVAVLLLISGITLVFRNIV